MSVGGVNRDKVRTPPKSHPWKTRIRQERTVAEETGKARREGRLTTRPKENF